MCVLSNKNPKEKQEKNPKQNKTRDRGGKGTDVAWECKRDKETALLHAYGNLLQAFHLKSRNLLHLCICRSMCMYKQKKHIQFVCNITLAYVSKKEIYVHRDSTKSKKVETV